MVFLLSSLGVGNFFTYWYSDLNNHIFNPTSEDPFYMVIHQFMPGTDFGVAWMGEIVDTFGLGTSTRRLGVAAVLRLLDWSDSKLEQELVGFLNASEYYNVPILLHLDSEHFYDSRNDLWNWWNDSLPGYNTSNVDNVEWSDWDTPTKKGFLNWGSPIELVPRLCFESMVVRAEISRKSQILVDKIIEWQENLTLANKSDLFLGIDPGWETGIDSYENVDWVPEPYRYHLGYNALSKRGFNATNPPQDFEAELANAVKDFAEFEAKTLVEKGIPKEKIFTHIWGAENKLNNGYHMHAPLKVAFNDYSIPGFSLYPPSYDILKVSSIVKNRRWTLMESPPLDDYREILRVGLNIMVVVYNWGGNVKGDPVAIAAIQEVLAQT